MHQDLIAILEADVAGYEYDTQLYFSDETNTYVYEILNAEEEVPFRKRILLDLR